jgi:hypothetical protein
LRAPAADAELPEAVARLQQELEHSKAEVYALQASPRLVM